MNLRTAPIAAVVALGLATTACSSPRPTASGASPGAPSPSAGVSASAQPAATANPALPVRPDPYAEAAEQFHLPAATVRTAVTDTRIEMVRIGGDHGQNLHGVDPKPTPVDEGAHLDPRIISFFAGRLGVPDTQAHAVMTFLVNEWNEYDEQAAQNSRDNDPGARDRTVSRLATGLHISKARASWYVMLMIGRPWRPGDGPDRLEQAVADALGVTPAQFEKALAK